MTKLTQKQQLIRAHMFAMTIKNLANRLEYVSTDDDYKSGQTIAKDLNNEVKEFLKVLN